MIRVYHELADEYAVLLTNSPNGTDEMSFSVHGLQYAPAGVFSRQLFQSLPQRRNLASAPFGLAHESQICN